MKKTVFLLLSLAALLGCRNTFTEDYNRFVKAQTAAEGKMADAAGDYFVTIKDDSGLLVKADLPFPGNVVASQNRYPDKVEIKWQAVAKPQGVDSVTYSIYRKTGTNEATDWVRLAANLKECRWVDNAYAATATESEEETEVGEQEALLEEGVDYHYAVRAVFTTKVSDKQTTVSGSRLSYFAVGNLFRNVWRISSQYRENLNQIAISWYPVPGASFYRIDRAEVKEGETELAWVTVKDRTSQTSYTDYSTTVANGGVAATNEFRYRVIPYYIEGSETITAAIGANTVTILGALLAVGAPDAPIIVNVSKGDYGSGIRIEWEEMSGMKFRIYRATSPEAPFEPIAMTDFGANYYIDSLEGVAANRRFNNYYYKVSARNASNIDGKLSEFNADDHYGYGFFLEDGRISASKRVYPQQIDLIFDFKTTPAGDAFYVQYTADDGTSWNWVKGDGSVVSVDEGSFTMEDGLAIDGRKVVVQIPNYNQSGNYRFRVCAAKNGIISDPTKIFIDNVELYGRSNGMELTAGLAGPEIPELVISQGDKSMPNQIKINGKWDGMSDYGDHVDIKIVRLYSFGKDADVSKPIQVKSKTIADFGSVSISNGEFSFTDNLAPDINPESDLIKPMEAPIKKGETWTYWVWEREAWKYINRKMPFDMKAAVGCEYKIVARWKNPGSGEWPESESLDTAYGFPALNNDDFAHLLFWMREVAMNRLWHLLYPPYHGTMSTIIELLPSPQTKAGEYGGQVGYTAKVEGLGGAGSCWMTHYSDWGPDWDIHIEPFAIAIKFGSNVDFDMVVKIKTPLYDGEARVVVTLQNGMYVDRPRGGWVEIKQADGRTQKYQNLEKDDSIMCRYFPPKSYEERVLGQSDATNSYELTTINFKYPLNNWINTRAEDWTMYYGFYD